MTLKGTPDTAGACDDILTSAYVGAMCCLAECRPKMQPASPSVMDQVSKFVGNLTDGFEGLGGESKSETAPMSIVFVASEVAPWCVSVVPVANPLVLYATPHVATAFPNSQTFVFGTSQTTVRDQQSQSPRTDCLPRHRTGAELIDTLRTDLPSRQVFTDAIVVIV